MSAPAQRLPLAGLRSLTTARVALERTGDSLATREVLAFQLAHARARDAVHAAFDAHALARSLEATLGALLNAPPIVLRSRAANRSEYLRHPPLGRSLHEASAAQLVPGGADLAIVLGDGLSARAAERFGLPLLAALLPALHARGRSLAPITLVEQARVAVADEIGERLQAKASLILLGERPGLSVPSSVGAYLTWNPRVGRTDAERNCISNIHDDGLTPPEAAAQLLALLEAARVLGQTGVMLKTESTATLHG